MEISYFGQDSRRLFGVLHRPERPAHTGLVFCPAYGDEMVVSYTPFARWAKELARDGFAVFRYHPYGTGESAGRSSDFTFEGAVNDAVSAASYFKERVPVNRIGFVGLRFGGFLAAQAASRIQPDLLLLWSPIMSLRQYCRDLLRLRLATEMVHQQVEKVAVTTKSMIEDLEAGRCVDILGRDMSPELYRQMNTNPPWPAIPPAKSLLWLTRPRERRLAAPIVEGWNKNGYPVEFQSLEVSPFWEEHSSEFPRKFATASVLWLKRNIEQ